MGFRQAPSLRTPEASPKALGFRVLGIRVAVLGFKIVTRNLF